MKYQRSNCAAPSVPERMRYGILLHVVALLVIASLGHASAGLGADELAAQLRATQRSNLIEMGIILAISLSGMVAVAWYVRRKLAAAPRADRPDAEDR